MPYPIFCIARTDSIQPFVVHFADVPFCYIDTEWGVFSAYFLLMCPVFFFEFIKWQYVMSRRRSEWSNDQKNGAVNFTFPLEFPFSTVVAACTADSHANGISHFSGIYSDRVLLRIGFLYKYCPISAGLLGTIGLHTKDSTCVHRFQ